MQELVRPLLERGRRRGRLLIAAKAVHDIGGDRGPAGELGLERRHGGDGLRRVVCLNSADNSISPKTG
jgi:hypothetical protein